MTDQRLKPYNLRAATEEAIGRASKSTGMGVGRSLSLAPSWSKSFMTSEGPGRPTNDSAKVHHVNSPLLSSTSAQSSLGSRGGQQMTVARHYQLDEIHEGHLVESLLAQATDKYVDLTVKDGFSYVCTSTAPKEFIETRTHAMSLATGTPFPNLVKETARDYIKYANWYWVKARTKSEEVVIGGRKLTPANKLSPSGRQVPVPIGGYYRAQPRHMFPVYDKTTGNLTGWIQQVPGKQAREFHLEDVIHGAYKPEAGDTLGVPQSGPVIEDIKTLRDVEEVVGKMLFKHCTPMIHHAVPDVTGDGHGTDEDIRRAAEAWNAVSADGLLVTSSGHEIKVLETKIGTIDASPFLKYFLQRVLMGLNLSESIMGIGNVGSGTSDMLTAQMHDRVKSLQNDLETVIYYKVFIELLVEAGFNPLTRESDRVYLQFTEIEIDTEIKLQNHYTQQYMNNVITEDENRKYSKLNPLTKEERQGLYINKIQLPLVEAEGDITGTDNKDVMSHGHGLDKDLATHNHKLNLKAAEHGAALEPAKTTVTQKKTGVSGASRTTSTTTVAPPKSSAVGTKSSPDGKGAQRAGASQNNPSNAHGSRGGPRLGPGSATPADKK